VVAAEEGLDPAAGTELDEPNLTQDLAGHAHGTSTASKTRATMSSAEISSASAS
jgi:hypothetical protein